MNVMSMMIDNGDDGDANGHNRHVFNDGDHQYRCFESMINSQNIMMMRSCSS